MPYTIAVSLEMSDEPNIQLEPKDIKYGWVIFQIPEILKNRRIERYRIIVQDVENNISKAECLLIKEIHYDD